LNRGGIDRSSERFDFRHGLAGRFHPQGATGITAGDPADGKLLLGICQQAA
jgi:hypothetical protein